MDRAVVPGFTRVGYAVRRRLLGWPALEAYDLNDRVVLVTGATSGIGLATAEALARMGAAVVLLGRDAGRLEAARGAVEQAVPGASLTAVVADLGDPAAVRSAAREVLQAHDRLDVLVHNAGALSAGYGRAAFDVEATSAVGVLGPFLLTRLLLERLSASRGRVITVSSGGAYTQPLDVDGLDPDPRTYDGPRQYARVKRAQIALTALWAARNPGARVSFHCMHPGWIDTPGLRESLPRFRALLRPLLRTPAQGADTIAWLAAAPEVTRSSGAFWHDRARRPVHRTGATRRADTPERLERLWEWCETHIEPAGHRLAGGAS